MEPGTKIDTMALLLLAIGLVPLLGFAVLGHWSATEMGAGVGLALVALSLLWRRG